MNITNFEPITIGGNAEIDLVQFPQNIVLKMSITENRSLHEILDSLKKQESKNVIFSNKNDLLDNISITFLEEGYYNFFHKRFYINSSMINNNIKINFSPVEKSFQILEKEGIYCIGGGRTSAGLYEQIFYIPGVQPMTYSELGGKQRLFHEIDFTSLAKDICEEGFHVKLGGNSTKEVIYSSRYYEFYYSNTIHIVFLPKK